MDGQDGYARATRRLAHEEGGQVLILTGLLMTIMLVCTALVIDIGHAQLVQRQLQAGVDAAALAAAQDLPDTAQAITTGHEYSPTPGSKNAVNTIDNATTTVTVRCITSIPGCNTRYGTSNAVSVDASASVPTFFGRIVGVKDLNVTARATACYPCSVHPLDVMLVLDRTGSMCNGGSGSCSTGTDIDAAKDGVRTFISLMDPKLDRLGLAVLPPATGPPVWGACVKWVGGKCTQRKRNPDSPDNVCSPPKNSNNYYGYDAYSPWWEAQTDSSYKGNDRGFYVVSSLSDDDVDGDPSDDYVKQDPDGNWDVNDDSPIVSTLDCIDAAGSTSYSMAIEAAQHELQAHGRPGVQKVIVFFTDGGANTSPGNQANGWWSNDGLDGPYFGHPCNAGVEAATRAKATDPDGAGPLQGTIIYTIGYDIEDQSDPSQRCGIPNSNGHQDNSNGPDGPQWWGRTPEDALRAMATDPDHFSETRMPGDLENIFLGVARQVLTDAARLVDNDNPDLVN